MSMHMYIVYIIYIYFSYKIQFVYTTDYAVDSAYRNIMV